MIDRFGKPIRVGYSLTELIWIEAALSLDKIERRAAFHDIACLTGRSYKSIKDKASTIALAVWEQPVAVVMRLPVVLPPSTFTLSKAALMAGKAPTRKTREILAAE